MIDHMGLNETLDAILRVRGLEAREGLLAFMFAPVLCRVLWHRWRSWPGAPHRVRWCMDCHRTEVEPDPSSGGAYR